MEVTGEIVRELPTRLNDGALGTQRSGLNAFIIFSLYIAVVRVNTGQTFAHNHLSENTNLEEQLVGVLSAVAQVGRADVVVPTARGAVELQEISGVQQNGIEGVDPNAARHEQQIYRGVRGGRVEEEVPANAHGHPGAHCTLRRRREDIQVWMNIK